MNVLVTEILENLRFFVKFDKSTQSFGLENENELCPSFLLGKF